MKKTAAVLLVLLGLLAISCRNPMEWDGALAPSSRGVTLSPGEVTLSGGYQAGHLDGVWDLTAGDMTISFTYNGNGLVDDLGAHAWAELGVRSLGTPSDFNPWGGSLHVKGAVDLIAGKGNDIGDVEFWISGGTLYVKYVITAPCWTIVQTHLAVGATLQEIPQTKQGNPIPGQFPQYPMVEEYVYQVPLSTPVPDPLYIAAHAEVVCGGRTETAWGGSTAFAGANWATYFTYGAVALAGSGVWLATDYDWTANTFDPDPLGAPTLDLDDKLILQRQGGHGEGDYSLPSTPPAPGNNHRIWWDRDGVDPWQNPATANTGGIYQIVLKLHAESDTAGTAYMNIRGLDQGFETDGNWNTIELTPAGMTFVGDMKNLVVFYGLYGYGATHGVTFSDVAVTQ